MELTLLVMAAGMGSRYGGLKQIDPVGPNDETLLDYSLYDAINAGFNKIIFIIRKGIEDDFKRNIANKIPPHISVDYVFQELNSFVPDDFSLPEDRTKPWGTGHAVLAAKDKINGPFAVINADDFYGPSAYQSLADFLKSNSSQYALVAYQLKNTLSAHGSVSRGICNINNSGNLVSVTEHTKIAKDDQGQLIDWQEEGRAIPLTGNEMVSLNLWGFQPSFFDFLQSQFNQFLKKYASDPKAEFYLPFVVDSAIRDSLAIVAVLPTDERWFGITYKKDIEGVKEQINQKIASGDYPENLWLSTTH